MSAAKRLVVCGGNGFLGSRICKYAVARGWDVTSISRSGQPQWDTVTSSASPPAWAHRVAWERGDILRPTTYAPLLKGVDYVVHSMGILLEADYKGVVSGRESPLAGLRKAFAPQKDRSIETLDESNQSDVFSYEIMNRDSAVLLAEHAAAEDASAFCYISAAGGAPVLPQRYITTKREAEVAIATRFPGMRSVFPRPPMLFDSSRPITVAMAGAVGVGSIVNSLTGTYFKNFMGAAGVKALKADTVAEAVVEALGDESVKGPIEVPAIEELAAKSWRKTML
ncbi:hypothetical protein S40285_01131 [Stachybotrys chlorohalonatus IBT 40285]|uniref:NAD-dependent epimerase/dehydratase domain-containing protein n=1 Tax=Stachybotrys chlorohalonatus (strain IBT 40285) TaxID=1283841 RepID=A0A084QXZ1_STAC4|nr:hypothetical protein S40285_01131 [Stachybotrys chlorohalonata IBT 40285]